MATLEDAAKIAMALAEVTEARGGHRNNRHWDVAGKMFALSQLGADSLRVSLKCEPALAEALRGAHAAVLPGYHLNKRHWNTVIIDGSLSDDAISDMIEDSYDLVVSKLPRARRRALGWRGDPRRTGQ